MTKRFCDVCGRALEKTDDLPLIRFDQNQPIKCLVLVTDINGNAMTDVCTHCRIAIITQGAVEPPVYQASPSVLEAASTTMPTLNMRSAGGGGSGVKPAEHLEPPIAPPIFVPSLSEQPQPEEERG